MGIGGALASLVGWMFRSHGRRIKALEERVSENPSRKEMDRNFRDTREEIRALQTRLDHFMQHYAQEHHSAAHSAENLASSDSV